MKFSLLAAGLVAAACRSTPRTAAVTSTPADTTKHYAIEQSVADSIERVRLNAFIQSFQKQSAPLLEAGNFLGLLQLLDRLQAAAGSSEAVHGMSRQLVGTYDSFLGCDSAALVAFQSPVNERAVDTVALGKLSPEDAVANVVRLATSRQAVFINEAHHVPRHRAFTLSLLQPLYDEGFRYLAVETLNEKDTTLNARGYPIRDTGFYSNEPMFGDMLRTALRIGFTLVPYEAQEVLQDKRETGQARNIADRILTNDPHARIVVYAGYSHIDESGTLGGALPMAVRFRQMTGIDPLTIDQTTMMDRGDVRSNDSRYEFLARRFHPTAPIVLVSDSGVWSAKPGVHDVTIVHPLETYRDGRSAWLWTFGGRMPYVVPPDACGATTDCVVTARRATESADAVPIDALRIGPRSRTLLLPPGDYVVQATNGAGEVLWTKYTSMAARRSLRDSLDRLVADGEWKAAVTLARASLSSGTVADRCEIFTPMLTSLDELDRFDEPASRLATVSPSGLRRVRRQCVHVIDRCVIGQLAHADVS